ncbi:shikimate kinase [Actinokineospora alba]|uniref:Shikimate kinase n=1 Tax=Actinokineospora alba TaxID=504798 RepID=A0A1H0TLU3_9PSEU|nr:shikimate kinase [Actinokineospora alba]TDP70577.1 shikimate kinase [Actinokineospora alba]SDJ10780.1 shikimate kinase [Actinokineospora alba]SDP54618.1 shikimate kinase [Actinokineospora alba]
MSPVAVVVGPPGAGKTTIGTALAEALGVAFRDTDADIVETMGKSISDIFTDGGEAAFRAAEEKAVAVALREHDGVLSLGGGAVLSEQSRKLLAEHTVVFLNVGMAEGVRRTGLSTARPLLAGVNPRAKFKELLDARLPFYREIASVEVDTDTKSPDEIVSQLATVLNRGE